MKYHDKQTVRRGDLCVAGTFGTCRIISTGRNGARIMNTQTGEKWNLDSMGNFDLLERKQTAESRRMDSPHGTLTVGWK